MLLSAVPLSGILMGVLVLGLILFFFFLPVLLHTKETDTAQYFNEAPAIPDRPRFHWSMLCCSAPRCRQTGAVMMKRRPRLLIKKNTAVSSADYSAPGKLHREEGTVAAAAAARRPATLLEVSNKAYSRRSLNAEGSEK